MASGYPGFLSAGFVAGISDRMDLGSFFEIQRHGFLTSVQGKYLLTPKQQENPFSFLLGGGVGSSTSFLYGGPVKSFRTSAKHEIAFGLRYNFFRWYINDSDDREDAADYVIEIFDEFRGGINGAYSYLSLDVSNTYWFSSRKAITLSVTGLSGLEKVSGETFKVGLKFHTNY